jgi:hypothetical protein
MTSEKLPADEVERDSAVLTKNQREYLLGETELETGSAGDRAMRSRIRRRTYNAILDFTLLIRHLPAPDREKIAVDFASEDWGDFYQGVIDMISFVYVLLDSESRFEKAIQRAVINGEVVRGVVEDALQIGVKVNIIHSAGADMADVAAQLADGNYHRVPPTAVVQFIRGLINLEMFNPEDFYEQYEEQINKRQSQFEQKKQKYSRDDNTK